MANLFISPDFTPVPNPYVDNTIHISPVTASNAVSSSFADIANTTLSSSYSTQAASVRFVQGTVFSVTASGNIGDMFVSGSKLFVCTGSNCWATASLFAVNP